MPRRLRAATVMAATCVEEQLKVLRAEHHVSSQFHDRTVAFFDAHL